MPLLLLLLLLLLLSAGTPTVCLGAYPTCTATPTNNQDGNYYAVVPPAPGYTCGCVPGTIWNGFVCVGAYRAVAFSLGTSTSHYCNQALLP
jgi:hypothetical protein